RRIGRAARTALRGRFHQSGRHSREGAAGPSYASRAGVLEPDLRPGRVARAARRESRAARDCARPGRDRRARPDQNGAGLSIALRAQRLWRNRLPILRRVGWTVGADLVIGYVAVVLYTAGDARIVVLLSAGVLILLIGAADVAWEMLVQ